MKVTLIAAAGVVAATVSQNFKLPSNSTLSTITEYYNTCTGSEEGTITTSTTDTYCPICEVMSMSKYPGGSMTTYTTKYDALVSGSVAPATYTITEPCPSSGAERPSNYIPQGFMVTTVPCGCTENTPVVLTTPAPAYAAAAMSLPAAAPAEQTPGAAAAAAPQGAAAPVSPPGVPGEAPAGSPAGAPAAAPGSGGPGEGTASSPPDPVLQAPVTNAAAGTATPSSNSSGITPFTGSASTTIAFPISFFVGLASVVAPLIFLL